MTPAIAFDATTTRFDLPFLVSGQAQKEMFINESLARIDLLLYPHVAGILGAPPAQPQAGQGWLVAPGAVDEWAGRDGQIVGWDGQIWTFVTPLAGMWVLDETAGARRQFDGSSWSDPVVITPPSGGQTVDTQSREAIVAILQALASFGLVAGN